MMIVIEDEGAFLAEMKSISRVTGDESISPPEYQERLSHGSNSAKIYTSFMLQLKM